MPKIKIKYDPNKGKPIRDGEIDTWANSKVEWYKNKINTKNTFITNVSSELCIDALRIKVKEGDINHEDLIFIYGDENEEITVNEHAYLSHYPEGFCCASNKLLDKLLGL